MRPHTGQTTAAAGLAFVSFLAWRLMPSCDSRLSSKAWAPLRVASLQALGSAARCSQALAGMSQARREFLRVFVALCLAPPPACDCLEPVQSRRSVLEDGCPHSHHVASPSELCFHDQDLNTWHPGTAKYLLVGDSVLPGNAQEPAEAADVELVQCF